MGACHEANPREVDAEGRTPLDVARRRRIDASMRNNEDPVVMLLRQAEATF